MRSAAGVFDIFTIYIGHRLGFYEALAGSDFLNSTELASRTGTHERYVREWLEQQTVSGILQVENADADRKARRFRLPAGHAEVLVDRDSLNYLTPLAQLLVGAVHPLESILNAYRNGGGVPYEEYGRDMLEGQAGMNRAMFLNQLGTRMACGYPGRSRSIPGKSSRARCRYWLRRGLVKHRHRPGLSKSPRRRVRSGCSLLSKWLARIPQQAGLSHRVSFYTRDASDPMLAGRYDLVTAFECVHDMSDPVGALRTMRNLAGDSGVVIVADERVGDSFTEKGNDVEWMMYGWSVLHCLPVGMADQPSTETGTVMRADTLRSYAKSAGFRDVEVLPIEHFFFRFYRLNP